MKRRRRYLVENKVKAANLVYEDRALEMGVKTFLHYVFPRDPIRALLSCFQYIFAIRDKMGSNNMSLLGEKSPV